MVSAMFDKRKAAAFQYLRIPFDQVHYSCLNMCIHASLTGFKYRAKSIRASLERQLDLYSESQKHAFVENIQGCPTLRIENGI